MHQAAERCSSRNVGFQYTQFSETQLPYLGIQKSAATRQTKTSTINATSPAMDAAPTTRLACSLGSVISPSTRAVAKKASTPLPASSQLTWIIGASTSKPVARVTFRMRCQAIQPTSVATPAAAKRPRVRAQGQAARATAASTPATTAETYVTDAGYINTPS